MVAIATPPHWHASISIACAEAGMDVLCEKPMTRFVAEGRAVVNAFKRYGRVFQIGTFGRFGRSKDKGSVLKHKIMTSGLLKDCQAVRMKKGGLKVKQWSGTPGIPPQTIPDQLDWDLYCGPSPWKPYESRRTEELIADIGTTKAVACATWVSTTTIPNSGPMGRTTPVRLRSPLSLLPLTPKSRACGHGSSSSMRMVSNS